MSVALFISVFAVATCGLVYELIAGTIASYLLGDSVTQFSTVIGVYLSAMGVGSYLTKYVRGNLLALFVKAEILVGLIGGFSGASLFLLFEHVASFRIVLYSMITVIGMLVGFEIPLILRIMKDRVEFKDLVSQVFALDYIGALFASILFPLVLVPYLGLVRSSFLFGIINAAVALWLLLLIKDDVPWRKLLQTAAVAAILLLTAGFVYSDQLTTLAESAHFPDNVVYAKSSRYQRIILTAGSGGSKLYLNGNLQFSAKDEYRYHEALVHPGIAGMTQPKRVLVLGGGDGLAVRELLKYPIENLTLVDLDSAVTGMFSTHPSLTQLNANALLDKRVTVINTDAFTWLRDHQERQFDFVVIDFPDPSNYSIGKLYSTTFFRLVHRVLTDNGIAVIQASSPVHALKSFWCVVSTLEHVGFSTQPYHAYVPSFGEWGFVLATKGDWSPPTQYPEGLRFISTETTAAMFSFPPDMQRIPTETNRLNNQALVKYFEGEWRDAAL